MTFLGQARGRRRGHQREELRRPSGNDRRRPIERSGKGLPQGLGCGQRSDNSNEMVAVGDSPSLARRSRRQSYGMAWDGWQGVSLGRRMGCP